MSLITESSSNNTEHVVSGQYYHCTLTLTNHCDLDYNYDIVPRIGVLPKITVTV